MKKKFYDFLKAKGMEFCYGDDKEGFPLGLISDDTVLEFLEQVEKEHKEQIDTLEAIIYDNDHNQQ